MHRGVYHIVLGLVFTSQVVFPCFELEVFWMSAIPVPIMVSVTVIVLSMLARHLFHVCCSIEFRDSVVVPQIKWCRVSHCIPCSHCPFLLLLFVKEGVV